MVGGKVYSDKYLLNAMEEFACELGRMPSKTEINNKSTIPSYSCYRDRFGTLTKIAKKLDLKPNQKDKWNKRDIINYIIKLIKELRKIPSDDDFRAKRDTPYPKRIREVLGKGWQKKPRFLKVLLKRLEEDLEEEYFNFKITGYWRRGNKFVVEPVRNGEKIWVGTFETEKEARKEIVKFRIKETKEAIERGLL